MTDHDAVIMPTTRVASDFKAVEWAVDASEGGQHGIWAQVAMCSDVYDVVGRGPKMPT